MDTYIESQPMLVVSELAENIVASEIIQLSNEIKARIADGQDIYNYTIGDFDPAVFPIPEGLKNQIIQAYENGENNYPMANGELELRKVVSRFLHTRGGLEYNEDQILISGGARPLIYAAYQTVCDPGDKVLFPVPSWNNNHYSHLSRAEVITIETSPENNFMPTAEAIKKHIAEVNLIALCSPLNPTGTVLKRSELEKICDLVLEENKKRGEYKKPVYVLFDQIYWQLTGPGILHFDPVSVSPEMKNYTIFVDGISKSFAATGVRVGWSFGPLKVIGKMKSILSHVGAWSPKAEQLGTARFLKEDKKVDLYSDHFKKELSERLSLFYQGFMDLRAQGYKVKAIEPQGAIYLSVQINLTGSKIDEETKINNASEVAKYLLNNAGIALVPFTAFGAHPNTTWFRLSVGTVKKEEISDFFLRLKTALDQLKV